MGSDKEKNAGQEKEQAPRAADTVSSTLISNKTKYEATREKLEAQPKVEVFVEARDGEFGVMEFCVNGVRYFVTRGVPAKVPKQIAEMLRERMASEGRLQKVSDEMNSKLQQAG